MSLLYRVFVLIAAGLLGALAEGLASHPLPFLPAAVAQPAASPARPHPYPVTLPPGFARAVERGTRTTTGAPGPVYWQQDASYTLTARLFPEEKRLEGRAYIRYANNAPDTLRRLNLELAQNLHAEGAPRREAAEVTGGVTLEHVVVDGDTLYDDAKRRAYYRVQGTQLVVLPPAPIAPGDTTEMRLAWSFVIPKSGAGGRMGHDAGNLFYLAYWYPILSVYDDVEGWNTDPFLGQSEFYAGFGDYDLTVEAPASWLVASTGQLQNPEAVLAPEVLARMRRAYASDTTVRVVGPADFDQATQGGRDGWLHWHFKAEQVRDVAFGVMRASIWEAARTPVGDRDGDGALDYARINTFYRQTAPRWKQVTRYQQHALTFLSEMTGFPYPWPHMTAVEGGGIIGGGMEYPMMTLIGDYNAAGDDALYYVTAHELAHMWIPMIVNPNERRYSWLDEGSTMFAENEARRDFLPGRNHHLDDQLIYTQTARAGLEGEVMRRSDFHYSTLAFGVASYQKPSAVLAALRGILGADPFERAYQTFIRNWAFKHPYPYDFFHTFEQVSGADLGWFWRSWYYETWTLDQAIVDVATRPGQAEVVVEDRGLVPMPVHLTVTLDDGTVIEAEEPVETWLEGATRVTISVATRQPVQRIEIDAVRAFPDVDRSNNRWEHPGAPSPTQ